MNDLRKAAEMALEALERYGGVDQRACDAEEALLQALNVDPVNMSQERVDETAKDRLVRIMGTFDLATGHADTMEQVLDALEDELRDVLGHLRVRHEWVGLTDKEKNELVDAFYGPDIQLLEVVEAKLKEKNGG